ncbi:hypothetical protein [Streptococcus marmotae]|uniref:hypothetical protein n=1 Tax=Streptococcus marmotae TaxID=1825069 RepID=UPI00082E5678|nr:hypothetical protein [Streptococcus marmotae]
MKALFQSEYLKLKGSGQKKLALLLPFLTIAIAFLIGSPYILESFALYWWEALFLFVLISLLCLYDYQAEKQAGQFQNVQVGSLTAKIRLVKGLLVVYQLAIASGFFLLFLYLVSLVFPTILALHWLTNILALFLVLLTVLWDIPFLYSCFGHFNPYLILVVNSFLCFLVAPFIAQTKWWYLFPYTYHYQVMAILLQIKPSGDKMAQASSIDLLSLLMAIGFSIILTGFGMVIWMRKRKDS